MPSFSETQQINAPSTTVFDMLADARNELRWNESVTRVDMLTEEPVGNGSKFIVEDQRGENEVTITAFDRPDHLVFGLAGEKMDVDIDYRFTESDHTTTAVADFTARPRGFMKVLLPLLLPLIKRDIAKQHVHFRELCEGQPG